jgi:hypothetical protein
MTLPIDTIAILALLGVLLVLAGRELRARRGLGQGKTVSLDNVTLTSHRLGLTGRVDRLVRNGGAIIPEEWKGECPGAGAGKWFLGTWGLRRRAASLRRT